MKTIKAFRFLDYILRKFNRCLVLEIDNNTHTVTNIYIDKVYN